MVDNYPKISDRWGSYFSGSLYKSKIHYVKQNDIIHSHAADYSSLPSDHQVQS